MKDLIYVKLHVIKIEIEKRGNITSHQQTQERSQQVQCCLVLMAFFNSLLGEKIYRYINLQVGVLVITNIFIAGEIIMLLHGCHQSLFKACTSPQVKHTAFQTTGLQRSELQFLWYHMEVKPGINHLKEQSIHYLIINTSL